MQADDVGKAGQIGFGVVLAAGPSLTRADAPQQLFEQALSASRQGSFAEALTLWDQVLERTPQDAAAWKIGRAHV